MALVSVDDQALADLDSALDEVTDSLATKIQDLIDKVNAGETLPAGDLSALQADVEKLRGLAAPPAG